MKTIILIIFLFSFTISKGQAPKPVNADSINKVMYDSVNKLIIEKMSINAKMIDSTIERIKSKISAKQFEQFGGAYQYFIGELLNYWLELNATKAKEKK
jgi:predicted DNA binding CopG/RHH family protein